MVEHHVANVIVAGSIPVTRSIFLHFFRGNAVQRYSFFIDDNIFWLEELTKDHSDSVFGHFFLNNLKKLHEKYQVKFLLNLFKGNQASGFLLEEFPDKWKNEFAANRDWLRFSFHAAFYETHYFDAENYIPATADDFKRDYNYVKKEICRFAGEKSFMIPQIIHFVEAYPEIKRFLYDEGLRFLADRRQFFEERSEKAGKVVISYPDADVPEVTRIPFELVLNNVLLENIEPELMKRIDSEARNYISIMTHEQHFYSKSRYFLPDHWERLDKAFSILTQNGYVPVWGSEIKFSEL